MPRLVITMVKRETVPIDQTCIQSILSSLLVSREWDNRNRWRDGRVQMLDKESWHLGPVSPGVDWELRTNRIRGAVRDFGGLPIRKDKGRVVDPLLVFKNSFFLDKVGEKKPCPGSRKIEVNAKERDLVRR
ncbi:hypothetical protein TNCV_3538941 [Trichonephila clavipes]|nr:hypothetical protein TNCV_3538941 [Trichonephila clavipes]